MKLFTVVTNAVCGIYFTHDIPMGFMSNVDETVGLLEFLLEVLTPFIGIKRLFNFGNYNWMEIVSVTVTGGRECLGFINCPKFPFFNYTTTNHSIKDRIGY